ncbi:MULTISPECIES: hypothetical protein [unclassified Pseudoalteromonas]|uniref:hypothetical protein n=1 Tax=unclassified Pseudoalteromonas TaxID=194690 RepID=UPI003862E8AD
MEITANNEVENISFKSTIEEMRKHYLLQLGNTKRVTGFGLSRLRVASSSERSESENEELVEVMGDTVSNVQAMTSDFSATTQVSVNASSEEYINSNNSESDQARFKQQMEDRRKKALAASEKVINAAFDKASELGEKHPNLQNGILSVTDTMTQGIVSAANFVADIVIEVVGKVINALSKAWSWITDQFATAAKSIGNFFSNIF